MKALYKKGIKSLKFWAVIAFFLAVPVIYASANPTEEEEGKEFSPSEMIMHHIKDTHQFQIIGGISIPLPVILYTHNGLDVFMSGAFYQGNGVVTTNKGSYEMHHEKIYYHHEGESASHERPLDLSITRNVFSLLMSFALMCWIFISIANRYKKKGTSAPKGIQSLLEPLIIYVRDEIVLPSIGEKKYATYLPYILTLFFFIWLNNLIGMVPFFPGGSNLSGNIAFTGTLAVLTFIIVNFSGNKSYWQHIFWMPGVPIPVRILLAPIELLGTVSKAFALMIRLFANITGGHIVVLTLVSMVFVFQSYTVGVISTLFALFILILELLVAALQAYVFALLTSLFIGLAVAEDDH